MSAPAFRSDVQPGSLGAWLLAFRPKTLPAAVTPVLLGTALSVWLGAFSFWIAGFTMLGALALQIASNLANDLFDFEKGADGPDRLGPRRVVQSGLLSPRQVRLGLCVTLAVALACGAELVRIGGWPIAVVGSLSMLAAVAYTAGPYPLGYHGLGDLFVFLFFGPVAVMGTVYLQLQAIPATAFWTSLSIGALTTNILVVNNLRDLEQDARSGKRTLVVRFGARFGRAQFGLCLLLGYGIPLGMVLLGRGPLGWLSVVLTLPAAFGLWRALQTTRGQAMNALLARSAQLLLANGIILSLGPWLTR